jgi:hypothetical protein
LLKKILYNHAKAKFHTNHAINQIIGNNIDIILLRPPSSLDDVIQDNPNQPNNSAATQTHTIIPIKIFQKNDQKLTSFGALSNIATSGLLFSLMTFCGFIQI